MRLEGKRVLIAGSSGFIGSHLKKSIYGREPSAIFELNQRNGSLEDGIKNAFPDFIFYCSGVVSSHEFGELFDGNVLHLKRLLDACELHAKGAVIVVLGSASVYGSALPPVGEHVQMQPLSQYGVSMQMRSSVVSYFRNRGLKVVEARLFNAIGPGLSRKTSVGSFIWHINEAKAGRGAGMATGTLSNRRDFVDVRDVADALVFLAENYRQDFEVFNVCSGKSVEVGVLLDKLLAQSGLDLDVETNALGPKEGDLEDSFGDLSALSKAGWKARHSLDETVDFCLNGHL